MSLTVAVLNSKGGVGKTTATIFLGVALAETGRTVEVWDADPQASATEWAEDAAEAGEALPFAVVPVNAASIKRREVAADVVLIDTPPGEASIQGAAARRADVVIVPTAPSILDLKRVWATLDSLGGVPAIVLLNGANVRTLSCRTAREVLDDAAVAVFSETVRNLEKFRRAVSTRPREVGGFAAVAAELLEVMREEQA